MALKSAHTLLATAIALAACDGTMTASQSFPGRTQVQFMSADGVTVRTYACVPGADAEQRGAQAHRYVDSALRSARARLQASNNGGFGSGLGLQAELNAETARISREAEADYRCALASSRDTRQINPFG